MFQLFLVRQLAWPPAAKGCKVRAAVDRYAAVAEYMSPASTHAPLIAVATEIALVERASEPKAPAGLPAPGTSPYRRKISQDGWNDPPGPWLLW